MARKPLLLEPIDAREKTLDILNIMETIPLALHPPDARVRMRPVRLSDAELLRDHCWPERPFATVYQLVMRARQNALQGRGVGVVVVGAGNAIKGYGQLTLWPGCAEISDLIVDAAYRGQGVGTAIIQYLARAAGEMHVACIEIGAALSNSGAVALYRRLGFVDDHTVWLNLGEGKEPVLFLRLNLQR
jgi:ribosomal protein S18 acetylase RimI-like enzyme